MPPGCLLRESFKHVKGQMYKDLKCSSVCAGLIFRGRLIQSLEPATDKATVRFKLRPWNGYESF